MWRSISSVVWATDNVHWSSGPGRQQDAAIDQVEERRRPQLRVEPDEVAVVGHARRREHHAALGPDVDRVAGQAELVDDLLAAGGEPVAHRRQARV